MSTFLVGAVVLAGCSSKQRLIHLLEKQNKRRKRKNSNEAKLGALSHLIKEAEITIKTAAWTDERNQFLDKPAKRSSFSNIRC